MAVKTKRLRIVDTITQESCFSGGEYTTRSAQYVNLLSDKSGAKLPNYEVVISNGGNATNSFFAYRERYVYNKGALFCRNTNKCSHHKQRRQGAVGIIFQPEKAPTTFGSGVTNQAANAAAIGIRGKILSEQQAFSGLTFLGELKDTLHMLHHPASAARDYVYSYLKGLETSNKGKSRKRNRALAASWLEFSFGLKPLLNDVDTIAHAALAQLEKRRIKRLSYTGFAESASSTKVYYNIPGMPFRIKWNRDSKSIARTRYLVGYKVESEHELTLTQLVQKRAGFNSVLDTIPAAWELIPWSFFIDYFTNIGEVINANIVSTENVVWVCRTDRNTNELILHSPEFDSYPDDSFYVRDTWQSPKQKATYDEVRRQAGTDIPFGTVQFRLPGRNAQFLNIAALAALRLS